MFNPPDARGPEGRVFPLVLRWSKADTVNKLTNLLGYSFPSPLARWSRLLLGPFLPECFGGSRLKALVPHPGYLARQKEPPGSSLSFYSSIPWSLVSPSFSFHIQASYFYLLHYVQVFRFLGQRAGGWGGLEKMLFYFSPNWKF